MKFAKRKLIYTLVLLFFVALYGCQAQESQVEEESIFKIIYVAAGQQNSFALTDEGAVYAWGRNTRGELGIGHANDIEIPTKVLLDQRVTQIVPGAFVVALTEEGEVYSWGIDGLDANLMEITFQAEPAKVDLPEAIVRLGSGNSLGLAISDTGSLYTWGWNPYGQRGDGTMTHSFEIHKVDLPESVVDASGIHSHVMALTKNGDIYTWGSNFYGEIGNGEPVVNQLGQPLIETTVLTPYRVSFEEEIIAVATGRCVSYALTKDGILYAWGDNSWGQLGIGDPGVMHSSTPLQVAIPETVVMIVSGDYHAYALSESGKLYGWGYNTREEGGSVIGISSTDEYIFEPQVVEIPGEITVISAGNSQTWVVTRDKEVYGWGDNSFRQIDSGLPLRVSVPTKVDLELQ